MQPYVFLEHHLKHNVTFLVYAGTNIRNVIISNNGAIAEVTKLPQYTLNL